MVSQPILQSQKKKQLVPLSEMCGVTACLFTCNANVIKSADRIQF